MEKKKKGSEWKLVAIFIAPLILLTMGLFCMKSSLPFRVEEIRPTRNFSFQVAQTLSQEELERFRAVFSQPFTYSREGDQFYVFASQKGDYLLTFFKMRKLTPKYWLNYIPFPWLEQQRLNKIGHRERARQELFGSFKTAFEEFRHQTGLLVVHLFGTNWFKSKVHLIDQEGSSHWVSLDRVPFILQKKPMPFSQHIEHLLEQGKNKEAVSSLLFILDLVKDRCQRGLADQDSFLECDYGFIGNNPVFIDVGQMVPDDSLKTSLNTLREVFKVSQKITAWLEESHPSLVKEFQKEANDLLSLLEEL